MYKIINIISQNKFFREIALKTGLMVSLDQIPKRQINRSISLIVEQLNATYLTQLKEDQERYSWFIN